MERTAVFLDMANLEQSFRKLDVRVDYLGLRDYLGEGRVLAETFVYLPISPYNPEGKQRLVRFLQDNGFLVRSKIGKPRPLHRWKCNFDVEMAIDILNCAHRGRVDIVVIGSGDGDLLPVCEAVRLLGVRCEIAATRESLSQELVTAANGFVDLGSIIREQRDTAPEDAAQDTESETPEVEVIQSN
jgi:uncharacterized LabA/DUF88 family protein